MSTQQFRILLIDSNHDFTIYLTELIRFDRVKTDAVLDFTAAKTCLREQKYDLVISHIGYGKWLDFKSLLDNLPKPRPIFFIFSAYEICASKAYNTGVQAVFQKGNGLHSEYLMRFITLWRDYYLKAY